MDDEKQILRRSKIVAHPSSGTTPGLVLAEGLGIAQSGQMTEVVALWLDERGNYHIGWSTNDNASLAAFGAVLTQVAASRLIEEV